MLHSLTVLFQRTLPVWRSRQRALRELAAASTVETKTRSPQMMGVAVAGPGKSATHAAEDFDQVAGSPFSGEEPLKEGPRHCGQFSASAGPQSSASMSAKSKFNLPGWRVE